MKVTPLSNIPSRGGFGITDLSPVGDRGPTFGKGSSIGIQPGKCAGFWTSPYDGYITAVYLSIDRGGMTVKFRRRRRWKSGNPTTEDVINVKGYTIQGVEAHETFINLSDFTDISVFKGDVFIADIVDVIDPAPLDAAGNLLVSQSDGGMPPVRSVRIS